MNAVRALTESHPALEIASLGVHTLEGSKILLVDDTVVVSVRLRNVLFTASREHNVLAYSR